MADPELWARRVDAWDDIPGFVRMLLINLDQETSLIVFADGEARVVIRDVAPDKLVWSRVF